MEIIHVVSSTNIDLTRSSRHTRKIKQFIIPHISGFFHYKKTALCSPQSALLVLSLFSDRVEQFLRILRLPGELLLLPTGCLGFLHAAKFLGGVFQPQVSVSVERNADIAVAHQVLQRLRVHRQI